MTKFDPIAIVEEGYQPSEAPSTWLRNIGEAAVPFLTGGMQGGVVYFHGPNGIEDACTVASRDDNILGLEVVTAGMGASDDQTTRRIVEALRTPGISSFVEVAGSISEEAFKAGKTRFADSVALTIPMDNGGAAVIANYTSVVTKLDDATQRLWQRIAIHLGAGLRMQGRSQTLDADDVEAVLRPDGNIDHAEGLGKDADSQEMLRNAVKDIDRARTRAGRADPDGALELWRGLLAGRWSLVDHFDTDGKRFVLARRNDPEVASPPSLSRRERQVVFYASVGWSNGEIAYAMGLADTTIGVHLGRAIKKLGLPNRAALVRMATDVVMSTLSRVNDPRLAPDPATPERN